MWGFRWDMEYIGTCKLTNNKQGCGISHKIYTCSMHINILPACRIPCNNNDDMDYASISISNEDKQG